MVGELASNLRGGDRTGGAEITMSCQNKLYNTSFKYGFYRNDILEIDIISRYAEILCYVSTHIFLSC